MCNFANYYLYISYYCHGFAMRCQTTKPLNHQITRPPQPQFKIKENTGVRKIYSLIIWIILKNGLLLHP